MFARQHRLSADVYSAIFYKRAFSFLVSSFSERLNLRKTFPPPLLPHLFLLAFIKIRSISLAGIGQSTPDICLFSWFM